MVDELLTAAVDDYNATLKRNEAMTLALEPFARDRLLSTKRTIRDFDEYGLRRMMSPMEIARRNLRAMLEPSNG
jgi:hypothetical protein